MTKTQFPSDQYIIDCLNTYYDIKVTKLILLPLGADIDALVYKAEARDDSSYFVKIKHGHLHSIGIILQQMLHDAGIQEIIAPVKTKQNQIVQYIDDCSMMVYPFIDGCDGFAQNLTQNQWIELGKTLGRIHGIEVPISLKTEIRQEAYSAQWRTFVRSLDSHIKNTQNYDEIALKFLDALTTHKSTIQRLVDHAEKLADKLKNASSKFVLCHSDIHAGNVLLTKEGVIYIIDWDNPIMAPKERDLMFIGGGVGNVWNNPDEEKLFYVGYGETEINREIIAYYRCERIVEDIAEYSELLLAPHNQHQDFQNRLIGYNHFIAMFEQNGVVDIALRTYNTTI